ncbi:MAG: hypothetical protein AB1546_13970 [bacterium]
MKSVSIRANPHQKILFLLFFFVFLFAASPVFSKHNPYESESRIDRFLSNLKFSQEFQWVELDKDLGPSEITQTEKTFALSEPHGTMFSRRTTRTRLSRRNISATGKAVTNTYRIRIPTEYENLENLLVGYARTELQADDFTLGATIYRIASEDIHHYSAAAQISLPPDTMLEVGYSTHKTYLNTLIRPTLKTNIIKVSIFPRRPEQFDWEVSVDRINTERLAPNYRFAGVAKYRPMEKLFVSATVGYYTHGVPIADSTYSEIGSQVVFLYLNDPDFHNILERAYSEKFRFHIFSVGYEVKF